MQGCAVYFCRLGEGRVMGCFEPGTETSGCTEGEEFSRQQFHISHSYR